MRLKIFLVSILTILLMPVMAKEVGIIEGVINIAGITRNQDNDAVIEQKTSRPCPPFCIQPTNPFAPAIVDTISELDIIYAIEDIVNGDDSKLVIDARTPSWVKRGTIPNTINIPFNRLNSQALARDPIAVVDILIDVFGVYDNDGVLNYNDVKTLYFFCNGAWCSQSPNAIKALLSIGYPQNKLKYYRGGMTAWKGLGLTVE